MRKISLWLCASLALAGLTCQRSQAVDRDVTWIAPGDDCDVGRATDYQLVVSSDSTLIAAILATDPPGDVCDSGNGGLSRDSIEILFPGLTWQSTIEGTMPVPDTAGSPQAGQVLNLTHGIWHVILRAVDEAGNAGHWSRVIFEIDDEQPAPVVGFMVTP